MRAIRQAALEAVDPDRAVMRALEVQGDALWVAGRAMRPKGHVVLIALGKAAVPMTRAACRQLGGKLSAGLAAAPPHQVSELPPGIAAFPGGHPLPSEGSLAAGENLARLLGGLSPDDLAVVLISGGGSAMLELPIAGVTLEDLQALNQCLLRSGLAISQINTIRSAVSQVKAGGLARLAAPAHVVGLILSDVPGEDPASVASGPTATAQNPRRAAGAILRAADLWEMIPASVRAALEAPAAPRRRHPAPVNVVIASNRDACRAAAAAARSLGFASTRPGRLNGEARGAGARLGQRLRQLSAGACLVSGGETTVTIDADAGRGGRNQELALQAALVMEGMPQLAMMAFATDGIDGPTDAAGAIVTGLTASDIRKHGLSPEESLEAHDSYPALDAAGALLRTGATGTNVADIVVGLKY
jgi:hydroxypyruvate reductase